MLLFLIVAAESVVVVDVNVVVNTDVGVDVVDVVADVFVVLDVNVVVNTDVDVDVADVVADVASARVHSSTAAMVMNH